MGARKVCNICQQAYEGRCERCAPKLEADRLARIAQNDKRRGSAASRGYGHKWRVEREAWLKRPENRLCYYCSLKRVPKKTIATVIDHFIPHRGDQELFWDRKNWRPACKPCHDAKTARGQ